MRILLIGALCLAAVGGGVHAHAADSSPDATPDLPPELGDPDVDLVAAAEAYLDAGQLGPALELAERAVVQRLTRSRAHLVLARTLAAIRVHHPSEVCTWEAWQDRVQDHVRAAWALDGSVLKRVLTEPRYADVRVALQDTLALRLWPTHGRAWRPTQQPFAVNPTGLPVMKLEGLVKRRHAEPILVDLSWHGLDREGAHDGSVLDLRADGTAVRARIMRDADGTKHADYARGSWTLDKLGLHVTLDGESPDMAVTMDGLQVGSGEEGWIRWTDQPVDCTRPFDVWAGLGADAG